MQKVSYSEGYIKSHLCTPSSVTVILLSLLIVGYLWTEYIYALIYQCCYDDGDSSVNFPPGNKAASKVISGLLYGCCVPFAISVSIPSLMTTLMSECIAYSYRLIWFVLSTEWALKGHTLKIIQLCEL